MSKKKNVSRTIKDGTRVQTRDEYLDNTCYSSPGHDNRHDLYRTTYVVASNINDELVLGKRTTHGGKSPKGTISNYVNIYDNEGKPIKIDGVRFVMKRTQALSKDKLIEVQKNLFVTSKQHRRNRYLVHKLVKSRR